MDFPVNAKASIHVVHSSSLRQACERFLDDIAMWTSVCMAEYGHLSPSDVHDQATYTTGWVPYLQATGDGKPVAFMKKLRDDIRDHFTTTGRWSHGYWTMHEVHHGTEHFELFLGSLYRLDPEDGETIAQFIDVAEHLGNWNEHVPPWFDWEHSVYYSMWFGSNGVNHKPGSELNVADHFRCANLTLLAYEMSAEKRYLDLAVAMLGRWADAINMLPRLPVGLRSHDALTQLATENHQTYRQFAGQAGDLDNEIDRAENFLASNGIDSLLFLWQKTQDERFLTATERLLDAISTQLDDPDAGPAADILMRYRDITGSNRYDEQILTATGKVQNSAVQTLSIEPETERSSRSVGIGKRQDMPNWFENSQPRRQNPQLLAAAARIKNDGELATRAVDLARAYFGLARRVYPHGRHHGCSARSVSAVARGHGRDNNAGMVTGVLGPVLKVFL